MSGITKKTQEFNSVSHSMMESLEERRLLSGAAGHLRIENAPAGVQIGASLRLLGEVLNKNNQPMPPARGDLFRWKSSDPAVLRINRKTGVATPFAAGAAQITLSDSQGNRKETMVIQVRAADGPLSRIKLRPARTILQVGQTLQWTAMPEDAAGNTLRVRAGELVWHSKNRAVAIVNQRGQVTAVAPGRARITVTDAKTGISATAIVTVQNPPQNNGFGGACSGGGDTGSDDTGGGDMGGGDTDGGDTGGGDTGGGDTGSGDTGDNGGGGSDSGNDGGSDGGGSSDNGDSGGDSGGDNGGENSGDSSGDSGGDDGGDSSGDDGGDDGGDDALMVKRAVKTNVTLKTTQSTTPRVARAR
jgi:hypothetical protein